MQEEFVFFVYILASKPHGTLYVGMTRDLLARMIEHREGLLPGFTRKYGVTRLVHYDEFAYVEEAIQRERSLKNWPRQWKINLIERNNPHWQDLYAHLSDGTDQQGL